MRLSQIRQSWLRDALVEDVEQGTLDVRFFACEDGEWGEGLSNISQNEAALLGNDDVGGKESNVSLRSLFVPTECEIRRDLLGKMSAMFEYYLRHPINGTYFCNFDDDQYVNVRNLLNELAHYDNHRRHRGRNLYIGRQSVRRGIKIVNWTENVKFLTGGAGFCLSSDVVQRGRRLFTDIKTAFRRTGATGKTAYSDDVAVGYIATQELGAKVVNNVRFHSHYDWWIRSKLERWRIARQISFGYDTKMRERPRQGQRMAMESMPNVTVRFTDRDDPMLFRSLRCFLIQAETGRAAPECV